MSTIKKSDLDCPVCGASFIKDPHAKLHAATCVEMPKGSPPRFQCRCRGCGARGPKRPDRADAKDEWAKLGQRDFRR